MTQYTTRQISDRVQGRLEGPGDLVITGLEQLNTATAGQLTFIRDEKYTRLWGDSQASAAIVAEALVVEPGPGRALIRVANADLAVAEALALYAPAVPKPKAGVHGSATVDPSAILGQAVAIGPGCYVGPGVTLGDRCVLHANVTILDDTRVGADGCLFPGVVIRERCILGQRVVIHANTVIGADGFGYRPTRDGSGWVKIPQIGYVQIEDDVEIGSGTCIDRGKFSATVVGRGTKIDNLCQIAHNCQIGSNCVFAAQVGLAGGVKVEDGVIIGGQVGVAEHLTLGKGSRLAAKAAVMDDVPAGASWMGYPAHEVRSALREMAAVRRLPGLMKAMRDRGDSR